MEVEEEGKIPFLDVLLSKQGNGKLGCQVYRKKTHTDKYLHAESHHHPAQKTSIIHTLAVREARISDTSHLGTEMEHIRMSSKKIDTKTNTSTKQ